MPNDGDGLMAGVTAPSNWRYALVVLLCGGTLVPAAASAQQVIVPLQLSFSDPGARSMGFGGAFIALADDATAAFANPAGLVQLLQPEVSVEGRYWSYSIPFTAGGRLENAPSGFGIDDTDGLRRATSDNDTAELSFLSLAYPGERWSLAVYRHQYASIDFASETQGLFRGGTDCCQIREIDQRATSDLDILTWGLSLAYRLHDDLDVGLGLVYHDISLDALATLFLVDDDTLASIFGRNSYLPERAVVTQHSVVRDTDWTLTAGFLWRPSGAWRVGGVFRQGPKTDFHFGARAGAAIDLGVPPGAVLFQSSRQIAFPDIYGVGLAYRAPDDRLTVSLQWDRIEYSRIATSIGLDDMGIDDASQLHVGAEYVFLDATPIVALRLGAWLDPDHQMHAATDDLLTRALLPRGDDEIHVAAGLGVAMGNVQVDVAFDLAKLADTASLSAIFSF